MGKIYKYNFEADCLTTNKQKEYVIKSAMEMCQQGAVLHGCEIGLTPDAMASHNKFWVVSKLKLKFLEPIKLGDKVEFITYPIKPSGSFTLEREFLFNVKKQTRIIGTSKWCVVDTEKNSLAHFNTISDIMPKKYQTSHNYKLDYTRVMFDDNFKKHHSRKVMFNDLDINIHCNNQKYVEMALNCLPIDFINKSPFTFEINYIKQCYFGDIIDIYYKVENNCYYVIGKVKDVVVFNSCISFK